MIVCHARRFIFLKTKKTAGTSIEFALSALCGPDDILTPTEPIEEEHLRLGRGAQNYLRDVPGPDRVIRADGVVVPDPERDFRNHLSAKLARSYLGDEIWNGYFKFATVRNPWDREVSRYYFEMRHRDHWGDIDFRTFVLAPDRVPGSSWDIITIDGKAVLDFAVRYEHLESDFHAALARIGWQGRLQIPRAKARYRAPDKRDYRALYDADTHARILEWYGDEICAFGYTFDGGATNFDSGRD